MRFQKIYEFLVMAEDKGKLNELHEDLLNVVEGKEDWREMKNILEMGDLAYRYRMIEGEERAESGTFVALIATKDGIQACTKIPQEAKVIGYSVVTNDGSKKEYPAPYTEGNPYGVTKNVGVAVVWLGHAYVKVEGECEARDAVVVEETKDGRVIGRAVKRGKEGKGVVIGVVVKAGEGKGEGEALIRMMGDDGKELKEHMEKRVGDLLQRAKAELREEMEDLRERIRDGTVATDSVITEMEKLDKEIEELNKKWEGRMEEMTLLKHELFGAVEELKNRVNQTEGRSNEQEKRIQKLEKQMKTGRVSINAEKIGLVVNDNHGTMNTTFNFYEVVVRFSFSLKVTLFHS